MSLETLLRSVKQGGLVVNNLFQRNDLFWQANLRSRDSHAFYEFGSGPDAEAALEAALRKVEGGKLSRAVAAPDYDRDGDVTPAIDDEDDLIG